MAVGTSGADWHDSATPEQVAAVEQLYRSHRNLPYISPERDLAAWLEEVELSSSKAVPKWALEPVANIELYSGYLFEVTAGDIILLWRVGFDTFTTQSWFPKYFEYTYGIDAAFDLRIIRPSHPKRDTPRNKQPHTGAFILPFYSGCVTNHNTQRRGNHALGTTSEQLYDLATRLRKNELHDKNP